jgi:hypothetical protein
VLAIDPIIAEPRATPSAVRWPECGDPAAILRAVISRVADPRTDDRIVYELLRAAAQGEPPTVIGEAIFSHGATTVEADENVAVAVRELLERPFVDRVQSDERPRGYRRSGSAQVDLLVPGMPEHFIARMRGLWLPYPDGSVVTAREAGTTAQPPQPVFLPEAVETLPPILDPSIRRATLAISDETAGGRPLVRSHPPISGDRADEAPAHRTDCGWLV